MKILLELPYPPSTTRIYRRGKFATYLSPEGVKYKRDVADYVSENNLPKFGTAKVKIKIILRPRDKRKRDIDNCLKIALDSIESAGLIDSDFQVEELTITRGEQIEGGKLLIIMEDIDGA